MLPGHTEIPQNQNPIAAFIPHTIPISHPLHIRHRKSHICCSRRQL